MFHVHSITSKKNWILFSSISYISPMRDSHLRYGPSRYRRYWIKSGAKLLSVEIPTLNESKSKCVGVSCCFSVEIPTLNESARFAQGSAGGSWNDITATSGVDIAKGNRYLLRSVYRLFFMYWYTILPHVSSRDWCIWIPIALLSFAVYRRSVLTLTIYRLGHRWR
jgi:hypothetical protein